MSIVSYKSSPDSQGKIKKYKHLEKCHKKDIQYALKDYQMSKNPTQYPELYHKEYGRISNTDFEETLNSHQATDAEKNIFPIPIDEYDGYLSIDGLFDENGEVDKFLSHNGFYLDRNSFDSGNNTYNKLIVRFYNHAKGEYENRIYIIDLENKKHFPELERGIDDSRGIIKYVGYFGKDIIIINELELFSTVCVNKRNGKQIGPESQSIKIHKQGGLDILQFNEYINSSWDTNDFRMKEPRYLGSDGMLYEPKIKDTIHPTDNALAKNDSSQTLLLQFEVLKTNRLSEMNTIHI